MNSEKINLAMVFNNSNEVGCQKYQRESKFYPSFFWSFEHPMVNKSYYVFARQNFNAFSNCHISLLFVQIVLEIPFLFWLKVYLFSIHQDLIKGISILWVFQKVQSQCLSLCLIENSKTSNVYYGSIFDIILSIFSYSLVFLFPCNFRRIFFSPMNDFFSLPFIHKAMVNVSEFPFLTDMVSNKSNPRHISS